MNLRGFFEKLLDKKLTKEQATKFVIIGVPIVLLVSGIAVTCIEMAAQAIVRF